MRVSIFRRWPDESPSIKQYADHLVDGLGRYGNAIQVQDSAQVLSQPPVGLPRITRKFFKYGYIYGYYPLRVRNLQGNINHIVEHLYAHLLQGLDPHYTVVTCHDLMQFARARLFSPATLPLVNSGIQRWLLSFLPKAACVVADSENTRQDVLRLTKCLPDHVQVVYPGLGAGFQPNLDETNRAAFKKKYGLGSSYLILHVGNSDPYKNVEGIFHVLDILSRELGLDVGLVKVGQDFTSEQHRIIAGLGLTQRVSHLGRLDEASLIMTYQSCDVLLFPSLYEGFGWPPLEAMACGLPVVTSTAGSLPEVAGDAALSAPSDDHAGLARMVAEVLTRDELRQNLIARGLCRARIFTWEKSISQLVGIYQKVYTEANLAKRRE
jgi:glycosyltransferase involved in cell wall biosynthesis